MVYPDSAYPIVISPSKLNTTLFEISSSNEMKFKIKNVSESIVSISAVYVPEDYYIVNLPLSIEPGKTAIALIKLTEFGMNSNFENSFTISADDGRKFRFTIPVVRIK
jgi:hypothetical protein